MYTTLVLATWVVIALLAIFIIAIGLITKIEYRKTPITLKWFGFPVEKTSYEEARITIEYDSTGEPSTKQLFGEK